MATECDISLSISATSSSSSSSSSSHLFSNSSLSSLLESFPPSSSSVPSLSATCSSPSLLPHHLNHNHRLSPSTSSLMMTSTSSFVTESVTMSKTGSSTESMFSCTICHKKYSTEKYLQMHLALHKDISTSLNLKGGNSMNYKKFERHFRSDCYGQDVRIAGRSNQAQMSRFPSQSFKKHQLIQKRSSGFFVPRHQTMEKARSQCHYQFLPSPKVMPLSFNQQPQHFASSQSYGANYFGLNQQSNFRNSLPGEAQFPLDEENDHFRNPSTKYHVLALPGSQTSCYSSACYNSYNECPHYAEQGSSNLVSCAGASRCANSSSARSPNRNHPAYQRYQKASQSFSSLQHSAQLSQQAQVWTCAYCSKTFTQSSNYKNHVRTHSDERPYVCELCSIGFKERYHLKKHLLFKHSTEAKEECRFCGKRFKDSTAVRAHERIHSDQRPYSCQRCRKAFKTSECLWHHENRSRTCGKALDGLRTEGAKSCLTANSKNSLTCSQSSANNGRPTRKNQTNLRKLNGGSKKKGNPTLLQSKSHLEKAILSPVPSKEFFSQKSLLDEGNDCIVKVENDVFSFSSSYNVSCDLNPSQAGEFGATSTYRNVQHNLTARQTFPEECQTDDAANLFRDEHLTYAQLRPLHISGNQRNVSTFTNSRNSEMPSLILPPPQSSSGNFEKSSAKFMNFSSIISQGLDSDGINGQTCSNQFSERNISAQDLKMSNCRVAENFKFGEVSMSVSSTYNDQITPKIDERNETKFFSSCIAESSRFPKSSDALPLDIGGRWQQDAQQYAMNCLNETRYPRNYANQGLIQQSCSYDNHVETRHYQHHLSQAYHHHQYSPFYSHHHHHHHHHQHLLLPTAIVAPIKRLDESVDENGGASVHLPSLSLSPDQSLHSAYFTPNSSFTSMMASSSLESSDLDCKSLYQLQTENGNFLNEPSPMIDANNLSPTDQRGTFYEKPQDTNSSSVSSSDQVDLKQLPPFETFVPTTKTPPLHRQPELADMTDYDTMSSQLSMVAADEKDQHHAMIARELHSNLSCGPEDFQQHEGYEGFRVD